MKFALLGKISIALNLVVGSYLVCRHIYLQNKIIPLSHYCDTWDKGRESALDPLAIDTGDIVFVGNSITEGFPLQEMFHTLKVKNRGISMNLSYHILGRIQAIARQHPSKLFLDIGINDILNNVPLDTLVQHCQKIISMVLEESPSTKLYVQSVFPLGASHVTEEKEVEDFNNWLKNYCHFINITYIDIFKDLCYHGTLDPRYTYDDIHLTGAGYEVWRDRISPYIYGRGLTRL